MAKRAAVIGITTRIWFSPQKSRTEKWRLTGADRARRAARRRLFRIPIVERVLPQGSASVVLCARNPDVPHERFSLGVRIMLHKNMSLSLSDGVVGGNLEKRRYRLLSVKFCHFVGSFSKSGISLL
jgi:hypothetical protein